MKRSWLPSALALAPALALGCHPVGSSAPSEAVAPTIATSDTEELHAFAKLYGYVRFFHPSDEAAAADWDQVAVHGARRVVEGSTRAELATALREVFEPLAPTLKVFAEDQPPAPAAPPREGDVIAWQHLGYGFGVMRTAYDSGRLGRVRQVLGAGPGWAPLVASVSAKPLRGKRLRLRGWARAEGQTSDERAQLWLRIDATDETSDLVDNMEDRPIVSTEWTEATIEVPSVTAKASQVVFGGIAAGTGAVWFDDFSLEIAEPGSEQWTAVELTNPGFEAGPKAEGWSTHGEGFTYSVRKGAHSGSAALQVARQGSEISAPLFAERPKVGETFTRSLGAGLACRVVLGLPVTKPSASPAVPSSVPTTKGLGPEDPAVRAAAVVVAWNVLRHFYPYQDVIAEDWDAMLDDTLADVLDDEGATDLMLTLRRLVHRMHDGHGFVSGPGGDTGGVPLRLAHVEGRYIVLAAAEGLGVARGDELLTIDGVELDTLMAERRGLASGSAQWIDHLMLAWGRISEGVRGSKASIELLHDGVKQTLVLERIPGLHPEEPARPPIERLDDGVFYIDLARAPNADIQARIDEIAAAPGVVFDLRGYPLGDPSWLANLLTKPDDAKWMLVPHIIRPDYEGVSTFSEEGWGIRPAEPHIGGKVAFVTGPGAISYAESVMGYVEGYGLGAIVGAPTAGANGNVNPFVVPGGYQITYTGMKVTRMDGRAHHIVGVQPTHPVERTLEGIRAGRDEVLEAALAIVRGD